MLTMRHTSRTGEDRIQRLRAQFRGLTAESQLSEIHNSQEPRLPIFAQQRFKETARPLENGCQVSVLGQRGTGSGV